MFWIMHMHLGVYDGESLPVTVTMERACSQSVEAILSYYNIIVPARLQWHIPYVVVLSPTHVLATHILVKKLSGSH